MAPLPKERVRESFPFESIGLDFAGPLYLKAGRGKKQAKGYVCIFTCAVTRAVHLELCSAMTIESFWMAFKRFIATRGRCSTVFFDNAKTFVSVSKDLEKAWGDVKALQEKEESRNYLAMNKIKWKFIAERAPWWGGMYERLVRSFKEPLKKILGKNTLTAEEMTTLLKEIEAMVNSRPITHLSDDPLEPRPLTPFHFLIGRNGLGVPEVSGGDSIQSSKIKLTRILRFKENLLNLFWKRWTTDYLSQLNISQKWNNELDPVLAGEIVLISEDNKPRLYWPMGVVTETFAGTDGLVRSAIIRVGKKYFRRPVQRLHKLELQGPAEAVDQTTDPEADVDQTIDPEEPNPVEEPTEETIPENRVEETTDASVGHSGENVEETFPIVKTRCGRAVRLPYRFRF